MRQFREVEAVKYKGKCINVQSDNHSMFNKFGVCETRQIGVVRLSVGGDIKTFVDLWNVVDSTGLRGK